jgi:predicted outer membrane repeat protein
MVITNSTISHNAGAYFGGGIGMSMGLHYITNCTIANNSCELGGGGIKVSGDLYLKNTIVANNVSTTTAYEDYDDASGVQTHDNGSNVVEHHNSTALTGSGTITCEQPNLNLSTALADNGGGIPTLALSAGSIAINTGSGGTNGLTVTVPDTDQRGLLRNTGIDIGAYEYEGIAPNSAPSFVGAVTTLTVSANAPATDIKGLVHASDTNAGQTLTWSQHTAPGHGTLSNQAQQHCPEAVISHRAAR